MILCRFKNNHYLYIIKFYGRIVKMTKISYKHSACHCCSQPIKLEKQNKTVIEYFWTSTWPLSQIFLYFTYTIYKTYIKIFKWKFLSCKHIISNSLIIAFISSRWEVSQTNARQISCLVDCRKSYTIKLVLWETVSNAYLYRRKILRKICILPNQILWKVNSLRLYAH